MRMRVVIFILCLAVLSSAVFAVISPVGQVLAQDAERGVPYLTLRDRGEGDDPSDYYGDGRGTLTAGWCGVNKTDLSFLAPAAEIAPFRIPEEILDVSTVEELPKDDLLSSLQATAGEEMLLYIHGYYINFEKGCRRATIFKENAGLNDRFLWFSWPSAGSLLDYPRDEVNIFWSAPDLADVIYDLFVRFGDGNVDLAAHSLGARGLALALYEVGRSNPEARFGEVALLAPDIDFDVFRKLLPRIRPLARSITIYTSTLDAALATSAQLHGYPRLGEGKGDASLLDGVEVIDTTDLPFTSANGHLYHIYNTEVGRDLNQLVTGSKTAADRTNLEQLDTNVWRLKPEE